MPSATAATRKQQQTRQLSEAIRGFVIGYKGWLAEALRREKLTLPQLRLLRAVEECEGQSAAALARACMVTPQTLQTMLQRAVREQWITRSQSAGNSRILTAALTAQGKAMLAHGKALAAHFEAEIWAGIGVDTVQQCTETLQRGVTNMDRVRAAELPATLLRRKTSER